MRAPSLSAAAALLLVGAGFARPQADRAVDAARASNALACDLYRELRAAPGNLFFSPYSISAALAMTRAGARGVTAREMDAVLHLPGGRVAAIHRALAAALEPEKVRDGLGERAKQVRAYELQLANALWGQEKVPFEESFLRTLRAAFGAPLERIDFRQSAAARERINSWVADETHQRIRNIVPPGLPTPETRLALANAIFFKAPWRKPFQERWTKKNTFATGSGRQVEAPLMHRVDTFAYAADEELQLVEIPYRGSQTAMVILLPRKKDGLAALEAKLSAARLETWLGGLEGARVSVRIPRFSFQCARNLSTTLVTLGMRTAFNPINANFSAITTAIPLFLGAVLHKAFIAVDEKGSEAAAATVVMMELGGMPTGKPIEFVADHPFLFLIRHRASGCVLFLGRVVDPTRG